MQPKKRNATTKACASAISAMLLCSIANARTIDRTPRAFDIGPRAAGAALSEFARQSQQEILFAPEVVALKISAGVRGTYDPLEALTRILTNTGLSFSTTSLGAILVEPAEGASQARTIASRTRLAQADAPQSVEHSSRAAASEPSAALEEIVVTGSNIRSAVDQKARPVSVVSSETIEKLGPQKLADVLRQEPAFTGGAKVAGVGGYLSDTRSTLNLRGLGDKYTLVLVNGRRFSAVGPANINDLPSGAIDRIEVLKDGSSSVYGSDAVAGVVNILLDKRYEGVELDSYYGNTFGTDAAEFRTSMKFGASSERARIVANLNYRQRNGTRVTDTKLGRTTNLSDIGGEEPDRFYTSPANIILPDGSRVMLDYNRFHQGGYSLDPADYVAYDAYGYNRDLALRELSQMTDRMPEQQIGLFGSGEYDILSGGMTLFGEVILSTARASESNNRYGVDFYGDHAFDFGPIAADHPYNPFGVELRDVQYALPEIGGLHRQIESDTYRVVGGVKGDIDRYAYEIGATYFRSRLRARAENLYSNRGLAAALRRPGADALNPFCFGCNTEAQIAGIRASNELVDTNQQYIFDAKLTGPLLERDNYSIAFAVGAEHRNEKYAHDVDPLTATGDIYYWQEEADFQDRRSSAAFAELAYNLEEGAGIPAVHALTVELSGRIESIEEVGDTFNPRIATSWQPFDDSFTLRASYGTSFTAPPIDLLRAEQHVTGAILLYPDLGFRPTDVRVGGNPDLDPETAESLNVGVILTPQALPELSVTVDYFRVDQSDVVLVPDAQAIIDGEFPGEVDFSAVRPLVDAVARNVAGRKVQGIDFSLKLDHTTVSAGSFHLSASGSYMMKFEVDNGAGFTSSLDKIDVFGFGGLPRMRGRSAVSWRSARQAADIGLTANYVGGFEDFGVERRVAEFVTYDLNVAYDLTGAAPGLKVNGGILNLLDEEPPFVNAWGRINGYRKYDPATANALGRFYFVGLKYAF